MSLPQSLRVSVTPPELELISCQQLVEIVPLISMEKTAFISVYTFRSQKTTVWHYLWPKFTDQSICQGAYGPLRPPNKSKIPLWMAVNLKLKKKCHIVAPDWLNVGMFCYNSSFSFGFFFFNLHYIPLISLVLCYRLPAGSLESGDITANIQWITFSLCWNRQSHPRHVGAFFPSFLFVPNVHIKIIFLVWS